MDADTIAARLRDDAQFRQHAIRDPRAVVAEHDLDVPGLKDATQLLGHAVPDGGDGRCEAHAALFALIASASRRE